VFSDDANAIEALQARSDATASDADWMVAVNAAWRKAKRPNLREPANLAAFVAGYSETEAARIRSAMRYRYEANPQPFPAYCLSNARARARKDKLRQQDVAEQQSRAAAAQDAPAGCSVAGSATWSVVTFAEKPDRDVLQALRDAGYRWGGGSWQGAANKLPECVRAMASRP
jgi:hypothetical protein